MKIDRDEPICGVRPALLKQLFKSKAFTTPDAMLALNLSEPFASQTLLALRDQGWIRHLETSDFIDCWERTSKATRLVATKLIKRFPVAEGRAILPKIVELAREVNADPDIGIRITEIRLFGSVLTAGENDSAGDIDLVVSTRRRDVSAEEKKRLRQLVLNAMPRSASFSDSDDWAARLVLRKVKKVSPKISLHFESDLTLEGVRFTSLYSYDVKDERELAPDSSVRSFTSEPADYEEKDVNSVVSGDYRFDPPAMPERYGRLHHISNTYLRYAQHMWVRGASANQIADVFDIHPSVVQAYLATALAELMPLIHLEPSIKNTIRHLLPVDRYFDVRAKICVDATGRSDRGEIELFNNHDVHASASCGRRPSDEITVSGSCDLVPLVEAIAAATRLWITKMKPKCKGMALSTEVVIKAQDDLCSSAPGQWLDYRPLANAMRAAMLRHLPGSHTRSSADHSYLYVEFGRNLAVSHGLRPRYYHEVVTRLTAGTEVLACRKIAEELSRKIELDHGDRMEAAFYGTDLAEDHIERGGVA